MKCGPSRPSHGLRRRFWPRYGPQLWLLPVVPVVFVFRMGRPRWALGTASALLGLLVVNAGVVAAVRMSWETNATRTLRRQLTELRQPGTHIEVSFRWFEIPVAERLKAWGVRFQTKGRHEIRDGNELMSVVEGYPGVVRYRRLPASGTR